MGNYYTRPVTFRQSLNDFPVWVTLGEKAPAWGLSRWAGQGLRFLPPDDEAFTLRGDRQRLVYKGRRRSHRFTILGDTAFEYDCILEKEPESNIVSLLMEGTEKFDFFRQPDFVKDPFLKGSYAVYKKETLIGEGIGKLCHIHRPQIIDSRGRRCRGDLSVADNELRITVPENFLSEAKYPVIVDPVIGSSPVGACHFFYYILDSEYEECLEGWKDEGASATEIAEYLEEWTVMPVNNTMSFNRWTTPEPLQGLCKVFFHVAEIGYGNYNVFAPVLFNESQNIPDTRLSGEEYGWLGTRGSSPPGWNTVTFRVQNAVAANSPLWLGLMASGIGISFDYGADYFDIMSNLNMVSAKRNITEGQHLGELLNRCDYYLSDYREALEYRAEEWIEELRPSIHYQKHNAHPKGPGRYDFKFSCYFQPVSNAYTRTVTAGVTLTDSRRLTGNYKRTATQTVKGTTALSRFEGFVRSIVQTAKSSMTLKAFPTLIRKLIQQAGASDKGQRFLSIVRRMVQTAGITGGMQRITQAKRSMADSGRAGTAIGRKQDFKRNITHTGNAEAVAIKRADYIKRFQETAGSTAITGVVRDVVLRIAEAVAALYETKGAAGFNRGIMDTAGNTSIMGGMITFFRILSGRAGSGDNAGSFINRMRVIQDRGTVKDDTGHTADYLRGLFVEAGNMAGTTHRAEYHRRQQDTAYSEAVPLRHLFIFIRLITGAYIRDYIIGRFLKSREELVIKSPVCREIILDSKVH
jgi:hypothetical protein